MKYIMLEMQISDGLYRLVPIIFPGTLVHSEMAEAVISSLEKDKFVAHVVSAGECTTLVSVDMDSSSVSLGGIVPNEGDESVINIVDYFHGISTKEVKPKYRTKPKGKKKQG